MIENENLPRIKIVSRHLLCVFLEYNVILQNVFRGEMDNSFSVSQGVVLKMLQFWRKPTVSYDTTVYSGESPFDRFLATLMIENENLLRFKIVLELLFVVFPEYNVILKNVLRGEMDNSFSVSHGVVLKMLQFWRKSTVTYTKPLDIDNI